MADRRVYIGEGQCEENFFRVMVSKGFIAPGRSVVFNLMQERLDHFDNLVTKRYDDYVCCVDTDVMERNNVENLLHNLRILSRIGRVQLLVQNQKFEHELERMVGSQRFEEMKNSRHNSSHNFKSRLTRERYVRFRKDMLAVYGSSVEQFLRVLPQTKLDRLGVILVTGDQL